MNNQKKVLLALLSDYINKIQSDESMTDCIDWNQLLMTAQFNNVLPFVYNQVKNFNIDPKLIINLKNIIIRKSSNQIAAEQYLVNIIDELDNAGIKFMILKGVILAKLYPHPEYRYTADADIHIYPCDFEAVQKIMTDLGYEYKYSNTVKYDYSYLLNGVHIEIHTRLFQEFYDKHNKIINEYRLDTLDHTMIYNILGKNILSLQPNEFLIHNICHMTKHFLDTGINLRHLTDIVVLINSYIDVIDFDYVSEFFKKIKIYDFVKYTLYFCKKYLGMRDISGFDYSDIDEEILNEYISDFLEHTNDNFAEINRTASFVAYYKNDKKILKNKLFPGREGLSDKFYYAKKHLWLLPVAWVHRFIIRITMFLKTSFHVKSLKNSRRRVNLFFKMGLLK